MEIPEPVPGLVIRYSYLWADEHADGREEGRKDRPVAIIVAIAGDRDDDPRVIVVPITHTSPGAGQTAVEIPADTKRRLGLDGDRSWAVLDEVNVFYWPGPDVRPVPGKAPATIVYGLLPAALTRALRDGVLALQHAGTVTQVRRSE